jgi:hypothetical protein
MSRLLTLTKGEQIAKFTQWLSDGESWIGVYEKQSSPEQGKRVAFGFDIKDWDRAKIGDHGPNLDSFTGWHYRLVAKCLTPQEAADAMAEEWTENLENETSMNI